MDIMSVIFLCISAIEPIPISNDYIKDSINLSKHFKTLLRKYIYTSYNKFIKTVKHLLTKLMGVY